MNRLLNAAIEYAERGFSVIATDALKQSLVKWKIYQQQPATKAQLINMFEQPSAANIAVITGTVSQHLEAIDIDSKNDPGGLLLERLLGQVDHRDAELTDKLVIDRTRSGGFHLIYRCVQVEGNMSLARRPTTEAEKKIHPNEKTKVLIETRGEGGYIIVPPSPGYDTIQNALTASPIITVNQRAIIIEAAKALNQYKEPSLQRTPFRRPERQGVSPLDDYDQRGDIIGLLQKHGWKITGQNEQRTYFKRPGDTDKRSSGDYNHDMNLFSVFSTSTEFEPGRGYKPYAVYTMLECNGDFKEAVRRLAKEGYGQSNLREAIKTSHPYRR